MTTEKHGLTTAERSALRRVDKRLRDTFRTPDMHAATVRVEAGDWTTVEEYVERIVEARVAAAGAEVLRAFAEQVEAAYPADRFGRAWAEGEDHRAGTIRTILDMIGDRADRVSRPGSSDGAS